MSETFVNKVADSGIITLNLEIFLPKEESLAAFDMKDYLFMELILKEKDFREKLKTLDISIYENKNVALFCSADAVIPVWAYMLATSVIQPVAKQIFFADETTMKTNLILHEIDQVDANQYTDESVVIKGCGEVHIPAAAYVAITSKLRSTVKSIMYGEPCSTVPVFKKPMVRPVK